MRLERLELTNFRSYQKKTLQFGETTVIVGRNGAGKSNILESIYLLSTGTSPRARLTEEMIAFGAPLATVTGIVKDKDENYTSLCAVLSPGVYMGRRTAKRRYLVDGVARTRPKFAGRLLVTLFRPEDLRLVEGSPTRRRQYLDETLAQASHEYGRALTAYEAALKRRNRLLDEIREGRARRTQLAFWDATIIKNGNILTTQRREYLEYLTALESPFGRYKLVYNSSAISPERLEKYASQEVLAGYTLVGPHKDDFTVMDAKCDLHTYGSRGEQRLAVLFLKMGQVKYLEQKLETLPIILLDDIMSELDQNHRTQVVAMAKSRQTIVTTAEEESVANLYGANIIRL